jgi:hypothetical protein
MTSTKYQCTITHTKNLASYGVPQSVNIVVESRGIEQDWDRNLVIINQPKQFPPKTWNLDLQRLKEVISITGRLEDEVGTDSTAYAYSQQYKRKTLRKMCQTAGNVYIYWDDKDPDQTAATPNGYLGNIIKGKITEVCEGFGDTDDVKSLLVQISFSIGDNKG